MRWFALAALLLLAAPVLAADTTTTAPRDTVRVAPRDTVRVVPAPAPAPASPDTARAPAPAPAPARPDSTRRAVPAPPDTSATRPPAPAPASQVIHPDSTAAHATATARRDSTGVRAAHADTTATRGRRGRRALPKRPVKPVVRTHDPHLLRWIRAASAPDSANVIRLGALPRVDHDSTGASVSAWDTFVAADARVGRRWIAAFMALARDSMDYGATGSCVPKDAQLDAPDELVLGVRFGHTDTAPSAVVMMRERCVQLRDGTTLAGRLAFDRDPVDVIRLAQQALPADTILRAKLAFLVPQDTTQHAPPSNLAALMAATQMAQHPQADTTRHVRIRGAVPDTTHHGLRGFVADSTRGGNPSYSQIDSFPQPLLQVPPVYPDSAKAAHIQGTVVLQVLVGADGMVKDVRVRESVPALDQAAMTAVRQWRFTPASYNHRPRPWWTSVSVPFTLP